MTKCEALSVSDIEKGHLALLVHRTYGAEADMPPGRRGGTEGWPLALPASGVRIPRFGC